VIVLIGLIVVIAAVIVGVAGVSVNAGNAHELTDRFAVFGYHVTGSTGVLYLHGIVIGALAVIGLSLVVAGHRRTVRRGSMTRRELTRSRRDMAALDRDNDELAGGSRHIRTTPSWRDRLERSHTRRQATVVADTTPPEIETPQTPAYEPKVASTRPTATPAGQETG